MEEMNRRPAPDATKAFEYLRNEAIDAHLAGDGMRVLHLCTIALENLRSKGRTGQSEVALASVRWAFFLNVYWMLDDWVTYSNDDLFKCVTTDDVSSWDRKLYEYVLTPLKIPLNFDSTGELQSAPAEWLTSRCNATEDVAALTLAIELTWYKDSQSPEWRELAANWLAKLSPSPLKTEIEQLLERLSLQSSFCGTGDFPDSRLPPSNTSPDQVELIEAWQLFYKANFSQLHALVRQLTSRIHVDSPIYPALFTLLHFSRFGRESKESQFLSLSRARFVESRQPAQACRQLRDERYESNSASIARKGYPDGAATERFTCLRMAMLNQLHSLRSWDIGGWILGERQRAQAMLEIAARGDVRFVRQGILSLRNALGVPDRGKYPHFDRSIELLDALSEDDRRAITVDLIRSPRIAWSGAHRVISELSDAIPTDTLADVARWNVKLDLDEHYGRWRHTWLGGWGDLLHWSNDAPNLIDILKPALLVKAGDFRCWEDLHNTLCSAIIKGNLSSALEIMNPLITCASDDKHFNDFRYSILHNVVRHRSELAKPAQQWLEGYVEKSQDAFKQFTLRNIDQPPEVDVDDKEFRDWLRAQILASCDKRLEERGGTVSLGVASYHHMMFQLTWPQFEAELTENLITVVETDYVPLTNKGDPIACLAILALRCPPIECSPIVDAAMKWLDSGIAGRELGFGGPLSTGQVLGLGSEAIVPAFAFLVDAIAEKHFDAVGNDLAKWVIKEGIRRPISVVDHTLRTAFHCSIGLRSIDTPMAVALVGIAEGVANAAFRSEPRKTVHGFSDVVLSSPQTEAVREWLATSAGALCLDLWQRRLVEVSQLARPNAREIAAIAIRQWEKSGIELPASLLETRNRLANDCRLRVRKAITD